MKKPVYVFTSGTLRRIANTLAIESREGKKYVPVETTGSVMVFGEVTLNKRVLEFFAEKRIPVHFFNRHGFYVGSFYPREHLNAGVMILEQAKHYIDMEKRMILARAFVEGSIENMIKVLRYYVRRGVNMGSAPEELSVLKGKATDAENPPELMGIEGNARDIYYGCFDRIIRKEGFGFNKRSKRPPRNRINALISFGNSLLYATVLSEIYRTHLDPRIGFLHETNFRRFSLNLDVSEVFKPVLVDRVIFALVNRGEIDEGDFLEGTEGVYLKEKARKRFVVAFEEKLSTTIYHEGLGRNVSYRTLIRMELYKIEKHLLGEKRYKPFVARW